MYYLYQSKNLNSYFISDRECSNDRDSLLDSVQCDSKEKFNVLVSLFFHRFDEIVSKNELDDLRLIRSDESYEVLLKTVSNGFQNLFSQDTENLIKSLGKGTNIDPLANVSYTDVDVADYILYIESKYPEIASTEAFMNVKRRYSRFVSQEG